MARRRRTAFRRRLQGEICRGERSNPPLAAKACRKWGFASRSRHRSVFARQANFAAKYFTGCGQYAHTRLARNIKFAT
ncbi:hypothetical protein E1H18_3491 [Caulobacter sp. RHG1]|nr:hypothetical protein [Caulobacter sp. RHG1]